MSPASSCAKIVTLIWDGHSLVSCKLTQAGPPLPPPPNSAGDSVAKVLEATENYTKVLSRLGKKRRLSILVP